MATENQLNALSQALFFDRPPFCSGTISPSPEGFHLYYGNRNPKKLSIQLLRSRCELTLIRFIDFVSATSEELDQLTAACEPATFGRGNEDVHDETYRKAGKIDASTFSVKLDPISSGLIQTIESQLVLTQAENAMSIRAEVCKLNVYGESGSPMIVKHGPPLTVNITVNRQGLFFQTPSRYSPRNGYGRVARGCVS